MSASVSPLAPKKYPKMDVVDGVLIKTAQAEIKYKNRTDLLLMVFEENTSVAGVFTRSLCPSAPVDLCRAHLIQGTARALVVNSGNANAFTGQKGIETVQKTVIAAAKNIGCRSDQVFIASTGVIGEPLDADKITTLLPDMIQSAASDVWLEAANAILTTDTYPKIASAKVLIGDVSVTINGIAKGAGMIAPDMATMLSFIVTDAFIAPNVLQELLKKYVSTSFNTITVDSDTSTSDTLLLFATGASQRRGASLITDSLDPKLTQFKRALKKIMFNLALQVVKDGEGARKLIEVQVKGAKSARSAKKIASSIANSPLVKTAVAGEDANWGRVVMAVGKAGEPANRDNLSIWFGDNRLAHNGMRDVGYDEAKTSLYMKQDHIVICADIGTGKGNATLYTCDLTKEYVAINGDYRS
jgi:glutamate N-acetyltransferase / amino-acid N-acetyltransferase